MANHGSSAWKPSVKRGPILIEELPLKPRLLQRLRDLGIRRLDQCNGRVSRDDLKVPGVGDPSIDRLVSAMRSSGYMLRI